ncbi:MAG: VWA domain-containing protein, partial [Gemmatimonadetes bacterium]|nr:VWA domain-containing protein [Gemmatimonadota bacterium]
MSFLSPWLLALAAGAAVPLLLHLLRRRTGLPLAFPAVRYLRRAEKEHRREMRLRNLLLMALRVAAVLALALAAARPLGPGFGTGHPPTAFALVLDNSMSSARVAGGRPVLDQLREGALAALAEAGSGDRVWLVTADAQVAGGSRADVIAALKRAEPLAGAGQLGAAVMRAAALVRSAGLAGKQVAVVTDAQASGWKAPVGDLGDVPVSVWAPAVPDIANHAVRRAAPAPPHLTPRGRVEATLTGPGAINWKVELGPRTVARGTAKEGEAIDVPVAPPERGWIAGWVRVDPDELRGDDARAFATWVGDAPRLTVDAEAGTFAQGAIAAL